MEKTKKVADKGDQEKTGRKQSQQIIILKPGKKRVNKPVRVGKDRCGY